MKEAFELIRERLEEKEKRYREFCGEPSNVYDYKSVSGQVHALEWCKKIVSEVEAEYSNPKTNADHIRAMTDEELAKFLCEQGFCVDERCPRLWDETNCVECITEWLKSEVK